MPAELNVSPLDEISLEVSKEQLDTALHGMVLWEWGYLVKGWT